MKMELIQEVQGRLPIDQPNRNLVHAVSADVHLRAGIAKLFRDRFGRQNYLRRLQKKPGGMALLREQGRYIFYLVTKPKYYQKPNPRDLWCSLQSLKKFCLRNNIRDLSMPKISTGLDQLSWELTVKPMLAAVFYGTNIKITVFKLGNQQNKVWSEQELKELLLTLMLRNWNRGYRNVIQEKFGTFNMYKNFVWSPEFVPTATEIRLWAEYFFRRITVKTRGQMATVGCWLAPGTPTLDLEEKEDKKKIDLNNQKSKQETKKNSQEEKNPHNSQQTPKNEDERKEDRAVTAERDGCAAHLLCEESKYL